MRTVYVESRLAGPLAGNVAIEVSPNSSVKEIIGHFLTALEKNGSVPGLAVFDKHFNKLDWNATVESQGIEEGAKLIIAADKSRSFRPLHVLVVGTATLVIAAVLFIVAIALFCATGGVVPYDYGVIIDAGSTHTEVFLYQWLGKKVHGTGVVEQLDSCEYEVGVANAIDPAPILSCVRNISKLIPKEVSSPDLSLGATGGMRLLNLSDPIESKLILLTLKYALSSSPFQVNSIEIIPGEDEAIYSWISTNFLEQVLNNPEAGETYGALDLGGASTQYAVTVQNSSNTNSSKYIELYGHEYLIDSRSFLCFGYFEAMDRSESLMLLDGSYDDGKILYDPCLPAGFTLELDLESLSQRPCVSCKNFTSWVQSHLPLNTLYVNGSSNYTECKKNVKRLLDEEFCEGLGYSQCLRAPKLGKLDKKYLAFSGFYYVVSFLNGTKSLKDFITSTEIWCSLTWTEILLTTPESLIEHVSRYCFAGVYITELLTEKYGFNSTTWKNLNFVLQIKGADVGWTLGYMINATNTAPERKATTSVISLSVFIPLIIISIIMAVVAILVLKFHVKRYCYKKSELPV